MLTNMTAVFVGEEVCVPTEERHCEKTVTCQSERGLRQKVNPANSSNLNF